MVRVEVLLLLQFCALNVLNDMSFLDKFRQNKFKLRDFRGELKRYNTKFLKTVQIVTYKYNRTTPAINGSFIYKIDIVEDIQVLYYEIQICTERKVVIQAYKFASNEYRMFPMRFQVNMCKALKADVVGFRRAMTCGNTTNCHFSKNVHYHVCNYFPDATKFPPNIPNGLFKIEAQLLYIQQELMVMDYYIEIYTTIN